MVTGGVGVELIVTGVVGVIARTVLNVKEIFEVFYECLYLMFFSCSVSSFFFFSPGVLFNYFLLFCVLRKDFFSILRIFM